MSKSQNLKLEKWSQELIKRKGWTAIGGSLVWSLVVIRVL